MAFSHGAADAYGNVEASRDHRARCCSLGSSALDQGWEYLDKRWILAAYILSIVTIYLPGVSSQFLRAARSDRVKIQWFAFNGTAGIRQLRPTEAFNRGLAAN
jgi:hypothetical protein